MGIQNLLRFLTNSTRDAHISEFENEYVAVDAYCWLHKGIYCCSVELAMKKPVTKYVTYCMRYIEMLQHFKVKPILVFDGRTLSSKKETEKKRREERQRKYKRGIELIKAGKINEGRKLLGESVDITHDLVLNLIKECRKINIDCIVAPFEADAQLAYFSLKNIVKCVITEDSDLLPYGCERVMFKMDTSGLGKLIEKNKLHLSLDINSEDFNEDKFRHMCILSGCDYLPSLNTIGPANALKFIKMTGSKDVYEALPKLPLYLNKMKAIVTPEYKDQFKVADNTFKYHLVYDPFLRKQIPLRPVSDDADIVGEMLPDDTAFQLAIGNIDPITMEKVDDFDPDKFGTGFSILWKTDLLPNVSRTKPGFNTRPSLTGSKKRQMEVFSFGNDLKKQRTPQNFQNFKSTNALNQTKKAVPETGFIFEPRTLIPKKKVTKSIDESNLLKSRYFFSREEKKQEEPKNDRRKGETYEEYLQRLCDEYLLVEDNETTKNQIETNRITCCKKLTIESSCSFCSKCSNCCICISSKEDISGTQKLNEYLKEFEEIKKRNHIVEHFLLDELYKDNVYETKQLQDTELENIEKNEPKEVTSEKELNEEDSSLSVCLNSENNNLKMSIDMSNDKEFINSQNNDSDNLVETEKINKVVVNEICIREENNDVLETPSSPVFKVQKDSKSLHSSHKPKNISDTAATPTSVYFSCSPKVSSCNSFQYLDGRGHVTSNRKPLSRNSAPSKFGKNTSKTSSAVRTLFQFGFKKGSKD